MARWQPKSWIRKIFLEEVRYSPKQQNISEGYSPSSVAAQEAQQELDDLEAGKSVAILPFGWPSFFIRNLCGTATQTVIHGMSSSGKTQLALQLLLGNAIQLYISDTPGVVAMNSLEMSRKTLIQRLASALSGINYQPIERGDGSASDFEALRYWTDFVGKLPIEVDDSKAISTIEMRKHLQKLESNVGKIHMLVTDYGELFSDDGYSREDEVSKVFRSQRDMVDEFGMAVLAISQDNYSGEELMSKFKIAGPNATRYSRSIFQACHNMIEVWNPIYMKSSGISFAVPPGKNENQVWAIIQKMRNGDVGMDFPMNWS
ncbi:hypothetical protein LCGC14_2439190, partial [marine sediment metagenome]